MYKEGDFVVRLVGCESDQNRNCEGEFDEYYNKLKQKDGTTAAAAAG